MKKNNRMKKMIADSRLGIALLVLALPFFCRAQKVALDAKEGEVVIQGKIGNINPPAQLWIYMGDEKWDTVAVRNGTFEYRKRTQLPAYGAMMVKYTLDKIVDGKRIGSFFSNMSLVSLFFEAGTMSVHSPVDTLSKEYVQVTGSSLHDNYMTYWKKEEDIVIEQRAIAAKFNEASPEQLQSASFLADYKRKNDQLLQRWDSLITEEVRKYPNSLHSYIAYGGYRRLRQPENTTNRAIAGLFGDGYRNRLFAAFQRQAEAKARQVKLLANRVDVGDTAPTFEQASLDGQSISLTDFRGKYVLVDFWASWCAPCRKVNPDLVKLYEEYKGANFEILGVSLDENVDKWKEAINADKLTWQHVSDLQGWKNEVVELYGIIGVPQSFLIDPEGKVVAKNLKPAELDAELAKRLKQK